MTGSPMVPIVVPIVMVIVLAIWIAIVYYANAHPAWKHGPGQAAGLAARGGSAAGEGQPEEAGSPAGEAAEGQPAEAGVSAPAAGQGAPRTAAPPPDRRAA